MQHDGRAQGNTRSADLRRAMVDNQVRTFDVTDQHVLEAILATPREAFLPPDLVPMAYSDAPLTLKSSTPGADDRVLMQPMFLAKLIQGATVPAGGRVLVVGAATGYAAALMAHLAQAVVALESDAGFAAVAVAQAAALGLGNLEVLTGRLADGHAAGAPYDVILVNGAVETNLEALFRQVAPGGCLVTIENAGFDATRRAGKAVRFDSIGGDISRRTLFDAWTPILQDFRAAPAFVF